jgi:hypothetical protein
MRDPQDREVELSFWESVRESPATLQVYLEKYPKGEFKPLAEIRLRELGAPLHIPGVNSDAAWLGKGSTPRQRRHRIAPRARRHF